MPPVETTEERPPIRLIGTDDSTEGPARPRVLITALGADMQNREALLRTTAAHIAKGGGRPVICATHLDMAFLVEGPAAVELLPLRRDLSVLTDTEYRFYLDRRWTVLLAKWAIEEEIDLGQSYDAFRDAELGRSGLYRITPSASKSSA